MVETTYVASVSGGKDSAALSLWLTEQGIEHRRVFADTGWEHPATYDYIRGPLQDKIGLIDIVKSPVGGFADWCRTKAMFPGRLRRFCTQKLKLEPLAVYMSAIPGDLVNPIGIRAAESRARSKLTVREDLPPMFGDRADRIASHVWRPLLRWPEAEVIAMHRRHGLVPNPLYLQGASRVGCWPCIFSRKSEIRLVSELTPERIDEIRSLEAEIQDMARRRYEVRGETFSSLGYEPPTMYHKRRKSHSGQWPIDEVVAWSRTAHGGNQYELFADDGEPGCVRWGMCEA